MAPEDDIRRSDYGIVAMQAHRCPIICPSSGTG